MKLLAKIALLLLATSFPALASTINFATGGGRGHMFVDSSGARLAANSLVRLGTLSTAGDLTTFQEFGRTTITNPGPTAQIGGFLTVPVTNNTPAANTAAAGKQIYLWVYNGTSEGSPNGVFTSTEASWTVPQTFTGAADQTSNLNLGLNTAGAITAVPVAGQDPASWAVGPVTVAGTANPTGSVFTIPVPEPSVGMLAIGAAMFLAGRRRK